jgi:IS30 family transposase
LSLVSVSGYVVIEGGREEFRVWCDQTIELAFATAQLTQEERSIIELKEAGGFTLREIAYELGYQNHESIRQRLKKINQKLLSLKLIAGQAKNSRGHSQSPLSRGET